jgi:hypothetical protein
MAAVLTEIADDPRQVCLYHLMIRVRGPEALCIKFLERLAREFEPALALFGNWLCHIHGVEISAFSDSEQAGNSQPQLLIPPLVSNCTIRREVVAAVCDRRLIISTALTERRYSANSN